MNPVSLLALVKFFFFFLAQVPFVSPFDDLPRLPCHPCFSTEYRTCQSLFYTTSSNLRQPTPIVPFGILPPILVLTVTRPLYHQSSEHDISFSRHLRPVPAAPRERSPLFPIHQPSFDRPRSLDPSYPLSNLFTSPSP